RPAQDLMRYSRGNAVSLIRLKQPLIGQLSLRTETDRVWIIESAVGSQLVEPLAAQPRLRCPDGQLLRISARARPAGEQVKEHPVEQGAYVSGERLSHDREMELKPEPRVPQAALQVAEQASVNTRINLVEPASWPEANET